ncbi:hypothetical protein BS78_02G104900 [Paspalum vaginatum]|nr:hypothetical protein BS78_02G104900 [Paspalum vaginatum]
MCLFNTLGETLLVSGSASISSVPKCSTSTLYILTTLNLGINFFSHVACPVTSKQTINSAYIVDDATMDSLKLFHDMVPPVRVNTSFIPRKYHKAFFAATQ